MPIQKYVLKTAFVALIVMLCCSGYVIANGDAQATPGSGNMFAKGTIFKSKTMTATVGNDLAISSLLDNGTHFILGGLFTVTGSPYSPSYSYDLKSNHTIINATWKGTTTLYFASYVPSSKYLTVNSPSGGSLNVTSAWYVNGTRIAILATPNANHAFQCINVDGVNHTTNPYPLTMSANHSVKAYFK